MLSWCQFILRANEDKSHTKDPYLRSYDDYKQCDLSLFDKHLQFARQVINVIEINSFSQYFWNFIDFLFFVALY